MAQNKPDAPGPLNNEEEVDKAIVAMAMRLSQIEASVPTIVGGDMSGSDMRTALAATLANLRELRGAIVMKCSEIDAELKYLRGVKAENAKLKYQMKHLKRSLEEEEAYVDEAAFEDRVVTKNQT